MYIAVPVWVWPDRKEPCFSLESPKSHTCEGGEGGRRGRHEGGMRGSWASGRRGGCWWARCTTCGCRYSTVQYITLQYSTVPYSTLARSWASRRMLVGLRS
eukprot:780515-Prorocentrum_minimum.AAC.1